MWFVTFQLMAHGHLSTRRCACRSGAREPRAPSRLRHGEDPRRHESAAAALLCHGRLREPLDTNGFVVLDGALSSEATVGLRADLRALARVLGPGDTSTITHQNRMRTDHVFCLDEHEARRLGLAALATAIEWLKSLGNELAIALDGTSGRLTVPPRVQAACYPGSGAYYRRHTDNMPLYPERIKHVPSNHKQQLDGLGELRSWRVYTAILYANDGWLPEHGGHLRLHHELGGHTDVEPAGGRLLLFNSLFQHEVRPTWERERWAITMWVWREDGDSEKFAVS